MNQQAELLRPSDAADFLDVSRSQLYLLMEDDGFPEKVVLGEGTKGFLRRDLNQYLERNKEGAGDDGPPSAWDI